MSRMFKLWKGGRIETVNPFNGCDFGCYPTEKHPEGNCWAAQMARRQKAQGNRGYENGFKPSLCPYRMDDFSKKADVVWIGDMGDIDFVPTKYVRKIIVEVIKSNPEILFFLETKDPATYERFIDDLPENVILSTTIESNRPYDVTDVPTPLKRFIDFRDIDWPRKHVSIEPIMKFDLVPLLDWIRVIDPEIVSVGYDNYGCELPESDPHKFYDLIDGLNKFTNVEIKTRPEELARYEEERGGA